MAWVYVLRNPDGRFYIGMTTDLQARVVGHNSGKSKWTKQRGPWELIWKTRCATIGEARRLERKLKRQHGGDRLKRFLSEDPVS
jgi:predicted GIY-YIG superfamily endonuclease